MRIISVYFPFSAPHRKKAGGTGLVTEQAIVSRRLPRKFFRNYVVICTRSVIHKFYSKYYFIITLLQVIRSVHGSFQIVTTCPGMFSRIPQLAFVSQCPFQDFERMERRNTWMWITDKSISEWNSMYLVYFPSPLFFKKQKKKS